jgi:hypothetical protein
MQIYDISLSMLKKILELHSKKREEKKERKKWEERGREKDKCHTRWEGPTSLKINLEMNNGHVSGGE